MRPTGNKENKKHSVEPVDSAIECLLVPDNELKSRQSLGKRRSLLLPKERDEYIGDENDDETERKARREAAEEEARKQKEEVQQKQSKKTPFSATNNFTKDQWEEHFLRCMQLCNQNKVNCKNAFKLKIIDYMNLIFLNKSKKIENLSLMSCTLDASAKIYSYRVDKVYADMVKVISGKEWTKEEENENENSQEHADEEEEEEDLSNKKKKKSRNSVFSELQLDKMLCKDDQQLEKSETQEGDNIIKVKTFHMNDIEYFLECPISDPEGELFLNGPVFTTSLDPGCNRNIQLGPRFSGKIVSVDPNLYLTDYKNMHNFFSLIGEGEHLEMQEVDLMYDEDEAVLQDDQLRCQPDNDNMLAAMNEPECCGDYDDCYMEDEVSVNHMNSVQLRNMPSVSKVAPFSVQAMTKLVSADHDEFSFFDNNKINFWSGPSHWSIKQPKKGGVKLPKEIKKCSRRVQGVDLSMEKNEDVIKAYSESINVTLATKTLKMWNKSKCTEPEDIRYTQKQMLSLFCNNNLLYVDKNFKSVGVHVSSTNDHDDGEVPLINSFKTNDEGEEEMGDGDHFDDINDSPLSPVSDLAHPLQELGSGDEDPNALSYIKTASDLIPIPPRVNEVHIDYAKTQKKINMKVLKATIWKLLNLDSDVQNVQGMNTSSKKVVFSNVYKNLFNELPKEDARALSFPIAFMALLHLANEKSLYLEGNDRYEDVTVMLASPPKQS